MSIRHLTVVFVFSKAEFTKFYCLSYSFHKKFVLNKCNSGFLIHLSYNMCAQFLCPAHFRSLLF